jgi:hypothetical protein
LAGALVLLCYKLMKFQDFANTHYPGQV